MQDSTTDQLRDYLCGFVRHDARPLRAIADLSALEGDPNAWWREEARALLRSRLRDLVSVFSPELLQDLAAGRLDAARIALDVLAEVESLV